MSKLLERSKITWFHNKTNQNIENQNNRHKVYIKMFLMNNKMERRLNDAKLESLKRVH